MSKAVGLSPCRSISQDTTKRDDLVTWECSVNETLTRKEPVHCWVGALLKPSGWADCASVLAWKKGKWSLLVGVPLGATEDPDVSFRSCSESDSCRCLTISSTVLTWASILIRRLLRQLWAVLSVLRSCALVKLYKAVSCTSFWMSSRAVLAVVSWSTCCCRRSKVRASSLSVESVPFFCRRGMSGLWQRFKQGWAREQHRVPWRDVHWHQRLPTGGDKPQPPNPPKLPLDLRRNNHWGETTIQGHPLVVVTSRDIGYWNWLSSLFWWRLLLLVLLEASFLESPWMVCSICSKTGCVFWSRTRVISCRNCRGWSTRSCASTSGRSKDDRYKHSSSILLKEGRPAFL